MGDPRGAPVEGDSLFRLLSSIPSFRDSPDSTTQTWANALTVGTFVLSSILLITNSDRSTLIERPTQSTALVLLISGLAIGAIDVALRSKLGDRPPKREDIPLTEPNGHDVSHASPKASAGSQSSIRLHAIWVMLCIVLRISICEQILRNIRCAVPGMEALLPIITLFMEVYRSIRMPTAANDSSQGLQSTLLSSLAAILVSWAAFVSSRMASNPRSTTICPADSGTSTWVLYMQLAGVLVDAQLLHTLRAMLTALRSHKPSGLKLAPLVLAFQYMIAAVLMIVIGLLSAIVPQYRGILSNLSGEFFSHILWASLLFIPFSLSTLRMLIYEPPMSLVILLFTIVSTLDIKNGVYNINRCLAPNLYFPMIPTLALLWLGSYTYFASRSTYVTSSSSSSRARRGLLIFVPLLVVGLMFSWNKITSHEPRLFYNHPIEELMKLGDFQLKTWSDQAHQSHNLGEAVQEYVRRYRRHPPPGFDKWYEYATNRSSVVIDDFDQIDEDLRPFWKLRPDYIRARTKLLLSDTGNDCAEVSIRGGKAEIGRVIPTHRWMVEGVIKMMEPFMSELPDMDIAFNINDEPRVAIPYNSMRVIDETKAAPENNESLQNIWSTDRASSWEFDALDSMPPLDMELHSFRKIWRDFGSVACPPDSPARKQQFWDSSTLCTSCYYPHSAGPFLSNWTLAADPCHQPDLALLHGFYLGPSAFRASHELLPIFSQSRAGGFSDILYPSAWNYNDKVKYDPSPTHPDPPFSSKSNTLFWRGGTTEGFSHTGAWKGSTRQRLVNAANNSTLQAPVLLPAANGYAYALHSAASLLASPLLAPTQYTNDLGFVSKYQRCDNGDCEAQEAHFGLAEGSDFQAHWQNRFLLDADGAGFSGRFLSFLQSRCLPVKTAVFREWYDGRVIAWKHFVPVDVRLHGLWSTMAYFATGGFGKGGGEGRGDPGERIAEAGREWVGKALRKEDMEIYFYRLLLEYGRVTDERRDEIGFKG